MFDDGEAIVFAPSQIRRRFGVAKVGRAIVARSEIKNCLVTGDQAKLFGTDDVSSLSLPQVIGLSFQTQFFAENLISAMFNRH